MFWGCITFDGVGTLTEIEGNMNTTKYLETLGDNVWPVIAKIFPNGGYIFQDDNAPCHASRRAVQWKRENELNCLNWPSQSPDLNIIENVWRTIKIKLQNSKCDILNKKNSCEGGEKDMGWTNSSLSSCVTLFINTADNLNN